MKNYVVGILSMFENDLKLFKVTAENEYEAVKKGMVEFAEDEENKQYEIDWQNSEDYPKDYEGLFSVYEEVPFSVIEVSAH
jgi:RecB family exonuclease